MDNNDPRYVTMELTFAPTGTFVVCTVPNKLWENGKQPVTELLTRRLCDMMGKMVYMAPFGVETKVFATCEYVLPGWIKFMVKHPLVPATLDEFLRKALDEFRTEETTAAS